MSGGPSWKSSLVGSHREHFLLTGRVPLGPRDLFAPSAHWSTPSPITPNLARCLLPPAPRPLTHTCRARPIRAMMPCSAGASSARGVLPPPASTPRRPLARRSRGGPLSSRRRRLAPPAGPASSPGPAARARSSSAPRPRRRRPPRPRSRTPSPVRARASSRRASARSRTRTRRSIASSTSTRARSTPSSGATRVGSCNRPERPEAPRAPRDHGGRVGPRRGPREERGAPHAVAGGVRGGRGAPPRVFPRGVRPKVRGRGAQRTSRSSTTSTRTARSISCREGRRRTSR